MSKIFKDSDVILDKHFLLLDVVLENEENNDVSKIIPYEKPSKKNTEVIWQARAKAQKIIENANDFAKKIIQNATQKAQKEFERAQKIGYENGYLMGKEKGQAELKEALNEFLMLNCALEKERENILCKYEDELKELALDIAKKVINTELEKDESLFISLYNDAVKQHSEQKWLKVTVSEYEAEFATSNAELLLSMVKGAEDIKFSILANAPRGTCIVETPLSITDTSVQTQLHKLRESFINADLAV